MQMLPLRVRTDNIVKSVLTLSKTSPKMASKVKQIGRMQDKR